MLAGQTEGGVFGSQLVVDNNDGIHIAYHDWGPLDNDLKVEYNYCPASAACAKGEGWIGVAFSTDVLNIWLAATKDGKPRLLLGLNDEATFDSNFYYAACDSSCGTASSWEIGFAATQRGTATNNYLDFGKPNRGFALDAQDRPGFVFYDNDYAGEIDHLGGFYTWCEANCTAGTPDAPTWNDVLIGGENFDDYDIYSLPTLLYTSDSKPRVLVDVITGSAGEDREGIVYKSCDANCGQSASWKHTVIADPGNGINRSWNMALDAQNRPHVALYRGVLESGAKPALLYLYCTSACAVKANWKTLNLGRPEGEGAHPTIEMQPNGKPAIAYLRGSLGVYLARCTGDCTKASGWKFTVLDTTYDLDHDLEAVVPTECDDGFWVAERPSLAFAADGRMRVVYDASYEVNCSQTFVDVNHVARILMWEAAEVGDVKVVLPTVFGKP